MKVSVLGAGAIGSLLGGLIKRHRPEVDVMLVVRGEHGRAINQRGDVRLEGPWGRWQVGVASSFDVTAIAGSDLVLLTVKSQASDDALREAQPFLGEAVVVSIQNGMNDEVLARYVPPARLVMGMTAVNVAVLEPGTARLQLDGATVVGPTPNGANAAAAQKAAELLRVKGLAVVEHPNVLGVRYNKLAMNALGYVSCLSQSNFITEAVCHRPWRTVVGLPLLAECIATFAAAGITLAKVPGRPDVRTLKWLLHWLDVPAAGGVIGWAARRRYNRNPIVFSLYQDLLRGKPTEVDFINGHVARLAEQHGLTAPYNNLACKLAHELERRGPACFFSRAEVIQRFQSVAHADRVPVPSGIQHASRVLPQGSQR